MSLFGKILAILNVLAAIGFFFMAMLDYAKRQTWADLAEQRAVLMQGLPLDENEPDLEGRPRVAELRQGLVDEAFRNAGGNPPRTQIDEVQKVKARLQAWVNSDEKLKVERLRDILMPLSPTSSERWALLERAADAKTDDLEATFNQRFEAVLSPTVPGKPDKHALAERKHAVASLLFRLVPVLHKESGAPATEDIVSTPAYNRALKVVGLNVASRALDEYAMYLEQVTADVRRDMAEARTQFANSSRERIDLLQDWAAKLDRQKDMYLTEKGKVDLQRALVDKRKAEVDKVLKDLAAAQEATRALLKQQAEKEQILFAARKAARDAYEENQKLELRIRALERLASPASER